MFVEEIVVVYRVFHSENFDFWKVRFYNCFIFARLLFYAVFVS
jgi:hypothetical protein